MRFTIVFGLFIFFVACKDHANKTASPAKVVSKATSTTNGDNETDTADKVLSTDIDFYTDSVFHGNRKMLTFYFKKYCADLPCSPIGMYQDKKDVTDYFEGIKYVGSIKNVRDSVFVLNPIILCPYEDEDTFDGQAYYFTDTSLPRLQTNSYCCHPENLFTVGDIDEDGISEIGIYYSSCASRFKELQVYTLKNSIWKKIGTCTYDLAYAEENKPYRDYIKKTGKNKFIMLEITDSPKDKSKMGKPNWLPFSM